MHKRQTVLKTKPKSTVSLQPADNKAEQTQHPLHNLQQQYGNHRVQQFVAMAKRDEGGVGVVPEVERVIQRTRGGGQALDGSVRQQMEPAFGADFADVRVHTDAKSDTLNRLLNSRAFATGRDIFFRKESYSPGSASGRELIAHELTHVVQQSEGQVQRKMEVSRPGDRFENEANEVARAVMQREQNAVRQSATTEMAHRQQEEVDKEIAQTQPEEEEENAVQTQAEQEEDESIQAQLQDPTLRLRSTEEEEQTVS